MQIQVKNSKFGSK